MMLFYIRLQVQQDKDRKSMSPVINLFYDQEKSWEYNVTAELILNSHFLAHDTWRMYSIFSLPELTSL